MLQLLARVALLGVQETHGCLSEVCDLSGKLNTHFIGWTSKAHSNIYDSEHAAHVAGTPVDETTTDTRCMPQVMATYGSYCVVSVRAAALSHLEASVGYLY